VSVLAGHGTMGRRSEISAAAFARRSNDVTRRTRGWQTRTVPVRLITIPISHYCEKARWALDRAEIPFTEERHLQGIHVWKAKRAGGGRTVPVLVTEDGHAIGESSEILLWTDGRLPEERRLYPAGETGVQAAQIEARLDAGFGPDGRLWMYHATLPIIREMEPWALAGTPRWERRAFRVGGRVLDPFIRRYLGVDDDSARTAIANVRATFDEVAATLADGRPFLTGERFTAADLTFAALSAPVLVPEGYGSPLPPPEALPVAMRDEVERLRAHPAGRFAARLYETERVPRPAVAR
jgi:glutathione S-transferase